jgi:hypothetical protein
MGERKKKLSGEKERKKKLSGGERKKKLRGGKERKNENQFHIFFISLKSTSIWSTKYT